MPPLRRIAFAAIAVPGCALGCLVAASPASAADPSAAADRVLQVVRSFDAEQVGPLEPIRHHTWNDDQRADAGTYSQLAIVDEGGSRCAQVRITDRFPWANRTEHRVLTIGPDYLPPETDAVRMRVKVLSGRFELRVGSPTVYFGHSDVLSESREVTAADGGAWQTLEFSLHHRLSRNQRRARFGRDSPVIYYTRWIQEPLYLHAGRSSVGEMLVDQVELIARGEGRPFPEFAPGDLRHVATIADFEAPPAADQPVAGAASDFDRAFTFFQDPIDFSRPPHLVRPEWRPPALTRVPAPATAAPAANADAAAGAGRHALRFEQRGTEETCFAGVRATGHADADGLAIAVRADHAGGAAEVVIDFMVYAAPPGKADAFPWQAFEPPASWQGRPEAFTYYLGEHQGPETSYAFYHARRTLPNGRWTKLVVPLADFICAYGRNEAADMFREQRPLAGESLTAVGWTAPYGARRHPTVLTIDRIDLVRLPGSAGEHHSYPQKPVTAKSTAR